MSAVGARLNIGNLVNQGVAGTIRIPGLMLQATSAVIVAELALRVIQATFDAFNFHPEESKFIKTIEKSLPTDFKLRPFKETPNTTLIAQGLASIILGNILIDTARAAFGPPSKMYNFVLALIGSIRVDDNFSYFESLKKLVSKT